MLNPKICSIMLGVSLLTADPLFAASQSSPTYSIGGIVAVQQKAESLTKIVVGMWGELMVHPDGRISGNGVIRYEGIAPCKWTPPKPDSGPAPHCSILNVTDGRFAVTGRVEGEEDTSHYLKHLSEMVVGQTRQPLDDIFAAAPVPMSIKITMTSEPKETVRYWGFEGGGVKTRELGVATGGLWVSGLIGTEFKLVARSDGHVTASRYESQGQYSGNWPISAAGAVYLLDVPAHKLPRETSEHTVTNISTWPEGGFPEATADFAPRLVDVLHKLK